MSAVNLTRLARAAYEDANARARELDWGDKAWDELSDEEHDVWEVAVLSVAHALLGEPTPGRSWWHPKSDPLGDLRAWGRP